MIDKAYGGYIWGYPDPPKKLYYSKIPYPDEGVEMNEIMLMSEWNGIVTGMDYLEDEEFAGEKPQEDWCPDMRENDENK